MCAWPVAGLRANTNQQFAHRRHQGLITYIPSAVSEGSSHVGTVSYATRMLCLLTVAHTATPLLLMAWLIPTKAQSADRVYRLGHLAQTANSGRLTREFSLPELANLGFVEGRNLEFLVRSRNADALPDLARELLAIKPDDDHSHRQHCGACGARSYE